MNSYEIIRAAIPMATDEECDFILWSRTPFPFRTSAREIYAAASREQRAANNQIHLCETCDNMAKEGGILCHRCLGVMREVR